MTRWLDSRTVTIAGYAVLALAAVTLHLRGARGARRLPSFTRLCAVTMRDPWGRAGVLLAWAWLGWHFLARS
jgi:Family of unknown function (DUF6186)